MTETSTSPPVALVTGAARRIGAEIVRGIHADGYRVVIHYYHSGSEASALAEELNAKRPESAATAYADLKSTEQLSILAETVLNTWQRCDLLVNNASAFYPTPVGTTTEEQWEDLMTSNLKAPYFLSQALAPELRRTGGSIINIADINGYRPLAHHTVYCAAKAGNIMLTRSLALELAPEIRVNGIAPGAILWPEDQNKTEMAKPEMLKNIPLQKLGGAESIVDTVRFLIKRSSYITGEIITVDGGKVLANSRLIDSIC